MSTRGVIVQPDGPDGFHGRYHHWDSYPRGLGKALWDLYRDRFDGDVEAMRQRLLDEHPAGWSTIVEADWSFAPGYVNRHDPERPCTTCAEPVWKHYAQYYPSRGLTAPPHGPNDYRVLGHAAEPEERAEDRRPQCYCHGERSEGDHGWIRSDGDDCGTEWAYVLGDEAMAVHERRWNDDSHMTGTFGIGADAGEGHWARVAEVSWDDEEPEWERLR